MEKEYLHSVFAMAHTDIRMQPFMGNHNRTLRLIVEANVEGFAISVKFANYHGTAPLPIGAASIALCNEQGTLQPGTLMPLTVGGVLHFTLDPGQELMSDILPFAIKPKDFFALNIYYPTDEKVTSGNWASHLSLRSFAGNFSADLSFPGPGLVSRFARTVIANDMTRPITTVAQIIAHCDAPRRVVGCFGDSITQQGNWTVPFMKRLSRAFPGEISLCNLGISGNRLLSGSPPRVGGLNGISGVQRFERDLLSLPGLTHAILELGTNDIGLPGSNGAPETDLITIPDYVQAMTTMAQELRRRHVKVYAATLPPRPMVRPYNEERELLRQQMNEWLRFSKEFDAVLDFDAVLRRSDDKPGMREGYALPDGLHPSPYGGLWMAKSIELALFGGENV